jgi:AAA+ superfamily predicted ATPase
VQLQTRGERTDVFVEPVVLDRLRGIERAVEISEATTRRAHALSLEEVIAPEDVKRALLAGLATHNPSAPARVVIRGRRGSGRHTLVAALARQVARDVAEVDVSKLTRTGLAAALALELQRAELAGCVPVISGLENLPREDRELHRHVCAVLRRHFGPLVVRTAPDVELPLEPERLDVTLPPLSLRERTEVWRRTLQHHELAVADADALATIAARFGFGAGTIARVCAEVARRDNAASALEPIIDEVARNYLAGRLERVATRVTRLADWDQVTLLDEMRDSVRELVGRMRYQRTVFEDWGFDRRISTARGLTALFYGPPGTGKTLVAGLIGRELGLDVWRIDLAHITSKWVGETEKHLAEVFEAAEEAPVMLLFDEADSLFGKRSEVKSSNDRYANLETNYLLQRFDSFEGVAILTTNLDGSIDPAFKRRLSMRMYFPFPDEDLREKLWASHIPPSVPRDGELDFASLARRYPLSGGYIRNSALRAAFLAAQEHRPLANDHLVRAVQLEYYELGKLSSSGRID